MDDFNKNSGLTGQNQDNLNNNEVGSTYWEMNGWQQSHETQEQSDNSYYSSNDGNLTGNSEQIFKQKKPRKKPLIVVAIIAAILVIATVTVFAFGDKIQNTLSLMTKNPKDYYAYIENRSVEKSVDKMLAIMNMSKIGDKIAIEASSKLSYDKETVGTLLASKYGMSIEDLEAYLGISLDSIGFNVIAASEDNEIYEKIGVNLNNVDIITLELLINLLSKEMFTRFPELSDAYLKQSIDVSELGEVDTVDIEDFNKVLNLLKSDRTGDFIKHYVKLITSEVKDVKLSKDEVLNVGDLSVKANMLTVTIYPEDVKNITVKMLEAAKDDEYITDFLMLINVPKEDFKNSIAEVLEEIKSSPAEYEDDALIIMDVYADHSGKILGRKIRFNDDIENEAAIVYFSVEQNNKGAYEFYINSDTDNSFKFSGIHTINNQAYTGKAVLDFNPEDGISPVSFEIDYEDLKTEIKDNSIYCKGTINLSSYVMYGLEIEVDLDTQSDEQLMSLKLKMGNTALVTLETSAKYLKDFKIPAPSSSAEIYDMATEIDDYYSTINIEEYITDLTGRLGIDLSGLLGNLIP